jgi:hypothetical protein
LAMDRPPPPLSPLVLKIRRISCEGEALMFDHRA